MFAHVDTRDYRLTRVGIALSEKATGLYHYLGSIIPHNSDSRDMTVFKDEDGRAYLFHSSEGNSTLYAGELGSDNCHTTDRFTRNFEKCYRVAPAVFKQNGKYHLLTSGCTGWDPNPAQAAVAENILGPWKAMGNPCTGPHAGKTFLAQGTFVFPVAGRTDANIAMFDRWNKHDLGASSYLWLPVRFTGEDMRIEWQDEWDFSCFG